MTDIIPQFNLRFLFKLTAVCCVVGALCRYVSPLPLTVFVFVMSFLSVIVGLQALLLGVAILATSAVSRRQEGHVERVKRSRRLVVLGIAMMLPALLLAIAISGAG